MVEEKSDNFKWPLIWILSPSYQYMTENNDWILMIFLQRSTTKILPEV